jgi:predicted dehydrogenase
MNLLRWGIIGCGDVCEVKSGPAFQKVPHSALAAVMRRNEALAQDFAKRHGVAKWYGDADALIQDPEVDAIYIATPPSSHELYALKALEVGKPVYIEKPMAHTAASAKMILEKEQSTGSKICIAHYRREQPLFSAVKSLLLSGAIGKVRQIELRYTAPASSFNLNDERVQWRLNPAVSGGGFFHDLAPHQLDLLFYFFGAPVNITGLAANTAGFYNVPDTVSASILFAQGALATCSWFFAAPDQIAEDYCRIIGSEGTLQFSIFGKPVLDQNIGGKESRHVYEPLQHVQQPMIAAVTKYFLNLGTNPCPAGAGVLVMESMEAIAG